MLCPLIQEIIRSTIGCQVVGHSDIGVDVHPHSYCGGVYSVNSTEMMSGLGIISEHITFTNFATSIGMAAFCPFLYRLVVIRREKMMCLAGFSMMYVLSYICAETDSIFLLALCSVLMGFLRMVLMMVNLFTLILYAGRIEPI